MGPLLAAALPFAGSVISGGLNYMGQQQTNEANAKQAQLNREFQERMSSTAYQRAVKDMQAAGLNPALAYQQGGANTPTGSSAQLGNPAAAATSGAQGAAQTYAAIQQARANADALRANTEKTRAETTQLNIESQARLAELQSRSALNNTHAANIANMFQFESALKAALERESHSRFNLNTQNWRFQDETFRDRIRDLQSGIRESNARAILLELQQPGARNLAAYEDSIFKRNASPFINGARDLTDLLSSVPRSRALRGPGATMPRAAAPQSGDRRTSSHQQRHQENDPYKNYKPSDYDRKVMDAEEDWINWQRENRHK